MLVELRRNTSVRDFEQYKRSYENIAEHRLRAIYMNEGTLLRFMKQLARINKWRENSLTPEVVVKEIMWGATMNMNGTIIKYSAEVPEGYMRI